MATIATGAVIVVALYALLESLIELLFSGSMWIAKTIMDSSITVFNESDNIFNIFMDLLPFSDKSGNLILSVPSIISGIAYGIMLISVITAIISSITSPLTGNSSPNPIQTGIRIIIAVILKNLIFGSSLLNFDGLLGILGSWFSLIMSKLGGYIDYSHLLTLFNAKFSINPVAYIGMLILSASLLGAVLGAAISYIERLISLAVSILLGPIAISLYVNKDTEYIAKEWLLSIFTQMGAIFLTLLMWIAFLNEIKLAVGTNGDFLGIDFLGDDVAKKIFRLAIAIAILSVAKNSEQIFSSFGLRTMPQGDSARTMAQGVASIGSGMLLFFRTSPKAASTFNNLMHGDTNIASGFGSAMFKGTPFTGNTSIYDKIGSLNSRGYGNDKENSFKSYISKGLGGGNMSNPISGPNSVRSANYRQLSSQAFIRTEMGSMKVGDKLKSANISDGKSLSGNMVREKNYSGSSLMNLAFSGHENGYQKGFSFNGDDAKMGKAIIKTKDGNDLSYRGLTSKGSFTDQNGKTNYEGTFFMPLEGGGNLSKGTKVDIGEDNMWITTGKTFNVDESGGKVFEIASEERRGLTLSEESIDSIKSILTEDDFSSRNNDILISEQSFGEENISRDIFDPEKGNEVDE